jgi:hypothetical protein
LVAAAALVAAGACGGGTPFSTPDGTIEALPLDGAGEAAPELPDALEEARPEAEDPGAEEEPGDEAQDVAPEELPPPCVEGKACDDGDPCTHTDLCEEGVCAGTKYACNDGLSCTHDLCDGAGGCEYPVREDRCLIGKACYEDGELNPENKCLGCVSPTSTTEWSNADGAECDDGNFCTSGDQCMGGACVGLLPNPCDDKNWCTDDSCDPVKGCVHVANDRSCSDGNACTVGDYCEKGKCQPGPTEVSCDDHNECTNDRCDPLVGCVHDPNTNPCNDDNVCTLVDKCDNGTCVGTSPKNCADTNVCTDDVCHPKLGCQHPDNQARCDDGNVCTDGDECRYGSCLAGWAELNCDDGNPCTADACDPKIQGCAHTAAPGPCDDGDPCTLGDFCEASKCKAGGVKVNCDDANPCTVDLCDATGACVHGPADLPCNDNDPCTVGDWCLDGACQPGGGVLPCADANPCTDDACSPGFGCVHLPNANPCSDGNACTVGDVCMNGVCLPGAPIDSCDDGNPCTADMCDSQFGCLHEPDDGLACDDGNDCSSNDRCLAGVCQGEVSPCDDGNACTQDLCLAGGGCAHELIDTPECKPEITITYPPRGAMLLGPPDSVTVTGTVTSKGGAITQFLVNDMKVNLAADGSFSHAIAPRSGTNIIRTVATNQSGGQAKGVRAFMFSHKYYPADPSTAAAAAINDGIEVFLGKTVFDDNDTSTPDDFATLILLYLKTIDIGSLIPSPLATTSVGWCTAKIYGKNLKYTGPDLDLYPINGGLHARVRITNLHMDVEAKLDGFLCPSASGDVDAQAIQVDVDLMVSVPQPGNVKVTLANQSAQVTGLDISLDGFLGFLLNWLIDLFSGTIADQLEAMVVDQIAQFAPVIEQALESLAIEMPITIPPLLGAGTPVTLYLKATVSSADFDTMGATIGLQGTALTAKGVPYSPLGSIARSGCLDPYAEPFHFIELNEVEFGIFDDLLNQLMYAMWYGGSLKFTITEADLPPGLPLSQYGIGNLAVDVFFLLPPMLTDCTADKKFNLQVGDIGIHASMTLLGQPIVMDAYASASAPASVKATPTATGSELSLFVDQDHLVAEIEIESTNGGAKAKYALTGLIETMLLPMIFEALGTDGPLVSFPIPDLDLGGIIPGLPPGTTFSIVAKQVYRTSGYTVLSGEVH